MINCFIRAFELAKEVSNLDPETLGLTCDRIWHFPQNLLSDNFHRDGTFFIKLWRILFSINNIKKILTCFIWGVDTAVAHWIKGITLEIASQKSSNFY
jgi:hypothetical protein